MGSMAGRVALVSGASSGIGLATSMWLAEQGADLALLALPGRDLETAEEGVARLGTRTLALGLDVGDSGAVSEAFERTEATLGPIRAVFNNAGMSVVAPITDIDDDDWEIMTRTNLKGNFNVLRAAAQAMKRSGGGAIVNTASDLGHLGQAGYTAYSATKGGILSMSRAAAAELAVFDIRVNSVSPGGIDTPMLRRELEGAPDPDTEWRENEATVPLHRFGRADEVAAAVGFLLSDQASYITGANLGVDGGRTTCFSVGAIARGAL